MNGFIPILLIASCYIFGLGIIRKMYCKRFIYPIDYLIVWGMFLIDLVYREPFGLLQKIIYFITLPSLVAICLFSIHVFVDRVTIFGELKPSFDGTICSCICTPWVRIPKQRDFFQKYKGKQSSCGYMVLPKMDMNDYDFDGVLLDDIIFHKKTKLPNDIDFFLKIGSRSLRGTSLPVGDYSLYQFDNVFMQNTVFRKKSIMPRDLGFFKKICKYKFTSINVPSEFKHNLPYYNLEGVSLKIVSGGSLRNSTKILLSEIYGAKIQVGKRGSIYIDCTSKFLLEKGLG